MKAVSDQALHLPSSPAVDAARRKLTALSQDGGAPEGLRDRASGLNETLDETKTGG